MLQSPPPNKGAAANQRCAIESVSHWFYNIIGFGGRALLHPLHPPQGYGGRVVSFCDFEPGQRPSAVSVFSVAGLARPGFALEAKQGV